jgi:hypothetical protein
MEDNVSEQDYTKPSPNSRHESTDLEMHANLIPL